MEYVAIGVGVVIVLLILLAIVGKVLLTIANMKQPVTSLSARVVAKRTEVSGGFNNMPASTSYYVTFEMEAGMRREFPVPGMEYGMLAEGDTGTLARRGTWYKGFCRQDTAIRQ